jgi:hypothetical protein
MNGDFWSALLQQVLAVILPVLATGLAGLIGAWIAQKTRELSKTIGAQQMASIEWAVSVAVNAAEQAGAAKLIEEKKTYAVGLAQEYLNKQGIKVNLSLLEGLIEAAVKAEIGGGEVSVTPVAVPPVTN